MASRGLAEASSAAAVDLGAADPLAQRLRRADRKVASDRPDRLELTGVAGLGLQDHTDRALTQLSRV